LLAETILTILEKGRSKAGATIADDFP